MSFLGDLITAVDTGFGRVRDEFNTLRDQTMKVMSTGTGPAGTRAGQRWFSTTLDVEMIYDGSFWVPLGACKVDVVATTNRGLGVGSQTIDGVVCSGALVLLTNQTDPTQNGVWRSGIGSFTPWQRVTGYDTWLWAGSQVHVRLGTSWAGSTWELEGGDREVGTDSVFWSQTHGSVEVMHHCRLRRLAGQTTAANATHTVSFDTELVDTSAMWSAGDPTKVLVPTTGRYLIHAKISFTNNAGMEMISVGVNGATEAVLNRDTQQGSPSNPTTYSVTTVLDLVAGDELTMFVYSTTASVIYVSGASYAPEFSVTRLPKSQIVRARPVIAHAVLTQVVTGTVCAHNANTKILFDSAMLDSDGMLDIAGDKITIQTEGIYELKGILAFGAPSSGSAAGYVQGRITINSVETYVRREVTVAGTVGHYGLTVVSEPIDLNVGDVIELWGQHTTGAGITRTTVPSSTAHFTSLSAIQLSDTVF